MSWLAALGDSQVRKFCGRGRDLGLCRMDEATTHCRPGDADREIANLDIDNFRFIR
jgi:hypothetical protein